MESLEIIVCVSALRSRLLMPTGFEAASFFRARKKIKTLGPKLCSDGISAYDIFLQQNTLLYELSMKPHQ
jgi:hypothetical protein